MIGFLVLVGFVVGAAVWLHRVGKVGLQLPLSIGDLANVLAVLAALFAVAFGWAAYLDNSASGKQQQDALNAARAALEKTVGIATQQQKALELVAQGVKEQQRLLEGVQRATEAQLALLSEQHRRQLEELGRAPQIVVRLGTLLLQPGTLPSVMGTRGELGRLTLVLRNEGNAALQGTTVILEAQPSTVALGSPQFISDVRHPNRMQMGGRDVPPHAVVKIDFSYEFGLTLPPEINVATLSVTVLGSNMGASQASVSIQVAQQ